MTDFDFLTAQKRLFASSLRPLERFVALAILDHWSAADPIPFPGTQRLVDHTGLERKAVLRAVRGLAASGAIRVIARRGESNRYDLRPLMTLEVDPERYQSPRGTGSREGPVVVPQKDRNQSPRGTLRNPGKEPNEGTQRISSARAAMVPTKLSTRNPEEQGDHQRVVDAYSSAFACARGRRPAIGPREAKAAKQLRERFGVEGAIAVISRALADPFWRGRVTILMIQADPDKYGTSGLTKVVQRGEAFSDDESRQKAALLAAGVD